MFPHDTVKAASEYSDKTREELLEKLISLEEMLEKQKEDLDRCSDVERSLRESEKKYRFLVENSKDIIWQIDLQGRWTFVSSNVRSILGYEPGQVVGKAIWDFIAPEYHDIVKKNIKLRLLGEERPPYEVEIIAQDGHYVPFELMASVVTNKNGIITGIQGISRDIAYRKQVEEQLKKSYEELETRVQERTSELTKINQELQKEINERKLTEEALRESEEKFRVFAETSSAVIYVYQGEKLVYVNEAASRVTGYSKDELLRMKFWDIMHPDYKELVMERGLARQRQKGIPSRYEVKVITKSGDVKWAEIMAGRIMYMGKPAGVATIFDITDRKLAEEQLRMSEANLARAQEIAHLGSWSWDLINNVVYWSDELYRIFGVKQGEFVPSYDAYINAAYPDDRVLAHAVLQDTLKDFEPHSVEHRIVRPDGSIRWIIVDAKAILDKYGKPTHLFGTAHDITERKLVEEALRESEEKFRVLAETSSAVICVYQGEKLVYVNDAAESITGYSKDELLRMKFWDFVHPDSQKLVMERGLARQRGEPVPLRYEIKLIPKTGEERWVEVNAGRITYMGKPAGVATFFDITERKKAEERMRLTQFAVDNCMDSSIWVNAEGLLIYVNDVTCQNLGYTREELLSMRIWDIDPDFTYSKFREKWDILKAKGALTFESIHRRKDGSIFPVEVSSNYLKYEDREFEVTFDRDITQRKRAEKEIFDAKAQAELYLDLMGHDINNLNQVALGFLELADDMIASCGKLGEDNKELIEKPMDSLNSSTKLIEKVMKLRKLRTKEIILEQVDLCNVLTRVKDRYSHVTGRDVTINYVPPVECLVVANELIDEIFINLIENSIKHSTPDRPLVIDIQQSRVCEDDKEYSRISVEDNGPGIPDNKKELIFERFYRGRTMAKGKGLGLYLVKTLVENFGGKIRIEDRIPGDSAKGSRFVVMLPSAQNP